MDRVEFNRTLDSIAPLLGRILLSAIFILSGISKITGWSKYDHMMTAHGLPLAPVLLAAATIIELAGGFMILTGFNTRLAAYIVFLYLIPVTLIMHNFWAFTGAEHGIQMINFMKNLAIMGGLLEFATFGPGRYAFDARDKFALPTYMKEFSERV